jgi:hypothetical protein
MPYVIYSGSLYSYYGLDKMILIEGNKSDAANYIRTNVKELFKFFILLASCTHYDGKNEDLSGLQIILGEVFNIDKQDDTIVENGGELEYENEDEIINKLQEKLSTISDDDLVDHFNIGHRGSRHHECFFLHTKEVEITKNNNSTILDGILRVTERFKQMLRLNPFSASNISELLSNNFLYNTKIYDIELLKTDSLN